MHWSINSCIGHFVHCITASWQGNLIFQSTHHCWCLHTIANTISYFPFMVWSISKHNNFLFPFHVHLWVWSQCTLSIIIISTFITTVLAGSLVELQSGLTHSQAHFLPAEQCKNLQCENSHRFCVQQEPPSISKFKEKIHAASKILCLVLIAKTHLDPPYLEAHIFPCTFKSWIRHFRSSVKIAGVQSDEQ